MSGASEYCARTCRSTTRVRSAGTADAEEPDVTEEEGDWAEQPRQTIRRARKARRTIINRNHLRMSKRLIISCKHPARCWGSPRLPPNLLAPLLCASLKQFLASQQLIHRAGAESFEVKGHKPEPKPFKNGTELASHLNRQSPRKLIGCNLNPRDLSVMADAKL